MQGLSGYAKGLLSLVGATASNGHGVRELVEAYYPMIDAERFLGAARRAPVGYYPLAGAVAGNNVVATVPNNRVWIARAWGANLDTPAASTCTFGLRVMTPASNVGVVMSAGVDSAALTSRWVPASFQDVILEAGTRLSVYIQNVTGGPFVVSVTGIFDELEC